MIAHQRPTIRPVARPGRAVYPSMGWAARAPGRCLSGLFAHPLNDAAWAVPPGGRFGHQRANIPGSSLGISGNPAQNTPLNHLRANP